MGKALASIVIVSLVLYGLYITNPTQKDAIASQQTKQPKTNETSSLELGELTPKKVVIDESTSREPSRLVAEIGTPTVRDESEELSDGAVVKGSVSTDALKGQEEVDPTAATEAKAQRPTAEVITSLEQVIAKKPKAQSPKSGELVLGNTPSKPAESTPTKKSETTPSGTEEALIAEVNQAPVVNMNAALPSKASESNGTIYFAFDSYDLSDSAETTLQELASKMKEDGEVSVQISGFTDSIGDPEVNKAFSAARSQTVYNKLLELGVPKDQLKIVNSSGASSTLGGLRNERRRVEISLVSPKTESEAL